jgi:hypothetical protein
MAHGENAEKWGHAGKEFWKRRAGSPRSIRTDLSDARDAGAADVRSHGARAGSATPAITTEPRTNNGRV